MTYKIEDGVPLDKRHSRGELNELTETITALQVGQSFVWPCDHLGMQRASLQARIHERGKYYKVKLASRKVEGGYRIWRIE